VLGYAGNQTTFQLGGATPVAGMTTTAAPVSPGDTTVKVASVGNLAPGNAIFVDNGANIEYDQIVAIGSAGAAGSGVTLAHPLTAAHATGVPFNVNQGQPIGYTGDTLDHLNYEAAGAPHGVDGPAQPTEELKRALELPAEWTSLLLAGDGYAGSAAMPTAPVAYFETTPVVPASTTTVSFDAGFARGADGSSAGLTYYWDFGDGTHATGKTVSHTFSGPVYADVKLAVGKAGQWGLYRQALPVDSPTGAAPGTPACGTFSPDEAAAQIAAASGGGTPARHEEVNR
jgi:PKD repeat protein